MNERKIDLRLVTTELPDSINGISAPDQAGRYVILLNSRKSSQEQAKAFLHEMLHVYYQDHERGGQASQIENERHKEIESLLQELQLEETERAAV